MSSEDLAPQSIRMNKELLHRKEEKINKIGVKMQWHLSEKILKALALSNNFKELETQIY